MSTRYRHKKTGSLYWLLDVGRMQTSNWTEDDGYGSFLCVDMADVVIYRGEDGKTWVRPHDEFFDGRFEEVAV